MLLTPVQLLTCSEGMFEIQHHELARKGFDKVSTCEDFNYAVDQMLCSASGCRIIRTSQLQAAKAYHGLILRV